jgi:A/G-specific adenine glycosylase
MMNSDSRKIFSKRLLAWWKNNKRDFPWRHTNDPYAVLIAEMLLRKTTAQQVDGLYKALIGKYPNAKSLSEADENELRDMIKPLGMEHKRAKLLKEVSRVIIESYKGLIPSEQKELLQLPGIGPYAANAVLSFSHAQNVPMVDTNFVRLTERVFGFKSSRARARDDKRIWEFAETIVPKGRSKEFNLAVIDFAASVCGARVPKCEACPLTFICVFFKKNS